MYHFPHLLKSVWVLFFHSVVCYMTGEMGTKKLVGFLSQSKSRWLDCKLTVHILKLWCFVVSRLFQIICCKIYYLKLKLFQCIYQMYPAKMHENAALYSACIFSYFGSKFADRCIIYSGSTHNFYQWSGFQQFWNPRIQHFALVLQIFLIFIQKTLHFVI